MLWMDGIAAPVTSVTSVTLVTPVTPGTSLQGIEWMLWMDDDANFTDMNFTFPFDDYDAAGINLVIWGDPQRVFRANDIQGLNT